MPKILSKCQRPSNNFNATPTSDRLEYKARMWCNRKRFKWQWKMNRSIPVRVPKEEDWEEEIEEFSRSLEEEKQKTMSYGTPYDAEEDLKVPPYEMSVYSVLNAPRPHQQHYNPSTHHTPPIKWLQHISCIEAEQFADADE